MWKHWWKTESGLRVRSISLVTSLGDFIHSFTYASIQETFHSVACIVQKWKSTKSMKTSDMVKKKNTDKSRAKNLTRVYYII